MLKLTKPGQFALAFLCFIALLCLKSIFFHFISVSKRTSIKTLPDEINEIKIDQRLLLSSSEDGGDAFSKKDFLNQKFLQLVSLSHHAKSSSKLKQNSSLQSEINFSYLLHELIVVVNVKSYYSFLWGCKEISSVQVQEDIYETSSRSLYSGLYQSKSVVIEVAKPNIDELISADCGSSDSDNSQENLDRCFLLKNRRILDEAALLVQLSHKSIARILGLCVQSTKEELKLDEKLSSKGVILIKETGLPARIEKLKQLSWDDRLKVCLDLLSLVVYFSNSPVGNLRLESWKVGNFIFNSQSKKIQLNQFDQSLFFIEPSCSNDAQCFIDGINCGIKCELGVCKGYNTKRNLFELNHVFLSPLLRYHTPQALSDQILGLLLNLNNIKITVFDVINALQSHLPKPDNNPSSLEKKIEAAKTFDMNMDPAILKMQKLPDGSEVDSWEKHESKIAINEIYVQPINKHESINNAPEIVEDASVVKGFKKLENYDFPGRFDYKCPNSKAEWGCVFSLSSVEQAIDKCSFDYKCKCFVTLRHMRKEGWIIAILKSDNREPVPHAGTNIYIQQTSSDVILPQDLPQMDAVNIIDHHKCVEDISKLQLVTRYAMESDLMKISGWADMTDLKWMTVMKEGKIKDAASFKPARGKDAVGGQMHVTIVFESKSYPAVFLAKQGPDEFAVSQLAIYQLDRMLGLYKTLPAVERRLSRDELSEAGFPVDVGGNLLDHFQLLKSPDGSLLGVIYPKIKERVTIEHYISVPKLSAITNAVTPFNKKQWDDLEYLLLAYLASAPFSLKGHQTVRGRLLHLKSEEAFLRSTLDYISYFNNCQFPSNLVEVLRQSKERHCDLGTAINSELININSPPISSVIRGNVRQLTDLVQQCITRFGEEAVLYNANVTPLQK